MYRGGGRKKTHSSIFFFLDSCQLIIMFTPVREFFKVEEQNGVEWAFAVAVGAGSLVMALIVKLLTR